jgi:hypothetical protein
MPLFSYGSTFDAYFYKMSYSKKTPLLYFSTISSPIKDIIITVWTGKTYQMILSTLRRKQMTIAQIAN